MQITWTSHNLKLQGGQLYSNAASARYRLILPARALRTLGHAVNFVQVGLDTPLEALVAALTGDVLVVSKLAPHDPTALGRMTSLMLDLMRAAQDKGLCVAFDVCDNHFDDPSRGQYFRTAVSQCDIVIASTQSMADITRRHTSRPVHLVSDPYEGELRAAAFDPPPPAPGLLAGLLHAIVSRTPRAPLRLLWFGHESNFESMVGQLADLRRLVHRYNVELHIVTSPRPEITALCARLDAMHAPALKVRFSPWSVDTTWAALAECDMVLIPSDADDPAKVVKSPNRLIESVLAGRFVCANPVPSYQAFGDFTWIGDDIVKGIEWALDHPHEALQKVRAGQDHVARHCSPEAIARQWEAAFTAGRRL